MACERALAKHTSPSPADLPLHVLTGLPAVVTMIPTSTRKTMEGIPLGVALRRLEESGAAVVGLNCYQGPDTILSLITEVRKECKGPIACLPSPYRASPDGPSFMDLRNPKTGTGNQLYRPNLCYSSSSSASSSP